MKISAFTIVRNAILMGYPVVESIQSILPIVDEFIVAVGQSDDNTKELIQSISDPKIKIVDTLWDLSKTKGGLLLSEKTNEALTYCQHEWCFYIQCDEVVHEKDFTKILTSIRNHSKDPSTHGLIFNYIHFYGSYKVIATARNWYRHEVRLFKKSTLAQSYGDAQGFRIGCKKINVHHSQASIYHYGWVKPPLLMGQKQKLLNRLWHGNQRDNEFEHYRYDSHYGLKQFTGTHPVVMNKLVQSQSWKFNPKHPINRWTLKDWKSFLSDCFEKCLGFRVGEYKNYRLLRTCKKTKRFKNLLLT